MKIHNFLISSTRPELLVQQITLFSKIGKNRRLNFYVFDDSDTNANKFLNETNKLRQKLPEVNIYYFNLEEQVKILQEMAIGYSSVLNVSKEDILNCFKENGKLQGIRSIQNKSIIIFYLNNKDYESIIHKLDDDIFPYEADRRGDSVEIIIKDDFFEQKEMSLNENSTIISGNNYTIDSPSPLVNYVDFSEFLFNFYNIAKNRSQDAKIGKDILRISPSKANVVSDPLRVLDILPIDGNLTYQEAVVIVENHAEILARGSSRIIINDNQESRDGINKFFPGGCVSFLYKNLPTLTPNFGNQDLLWELIEILDGKTLLTSGYIGHVKSLNGRPSIINDLKDSSYKHQTSTTYSVFKYLIEHSEGKDNLSSFQKNFINLMNKWLKESKSYSEQILRLLNNKGYWYADESKFKSTLLVKKLCSEFINSYREIQNNYSYSNHDVSSLMSNYYEHKKIFDNMLAYIVNE